MATLDRRGLELDRLKARLGESLRTAGTLDNVKAQIRAQFVQQASHSVFIPECGVKRGGGVKSRSEMLQHLGVSDESRLHNVLRGSTTTSLLGALVEEITRPSPSLALRGVAHSKYSEQGTQTDAQGPSPREALDLRLRKLSDDHAAAVLAGAAKTNKSVEERMVTFQRECRERCERASKAELERWKDMELGNMRVEMHAQHRREMNDLRSALQREHNAAQETLRRQLERKETESARVMESLEAKAYAERQKLLGDLEHLQRRESDMQDTLRRERHLIATQRDDARQHVDELAAKRETLDAREVQLDRQRESFRQQAVAEASARYKERMEFVEQQQALVEVELKHAQSASEVANGLAAKLQEAEAEIDRLSAILSEAGVPIYTPETPGATSESFEVLHEDVDQDVTGDGQDEAGAFLTGASSSSPSSSSSGNSGTGMHGVATPGLRRATSGAPEHEQVERPPPIVISGKGEASSVQRQPQQQQQQRHRTPAPATSASDDPTAATRASSVTATRDRPPSSRQRHQQTFTPASSSRRIAGTPHVHTPPLTTDTSSYVRYYKSAGGGHHHGDRDQVAHLKTALAKETLAHQQEVTQLARERRQQEDSLHGQVVKLEAELRVTKDEVVEKTRRVTLLQCENDNLQDQVTSLSSLLKDQSRALHTAGKARERGGGKVGGARRPEFGAMSLQQSVDGQQPGFGRELQELRGLLQQFSRLPPPSYPMPQPVMHPAYAGHVQMPPMPPPASAQPGPVDVPTTTSGPSVTRVDADGTTAAAKAAAERQKQELAAQQAAMEVEREKAKLESAKAQAELEQQRREMELLQAKAQAELELEKQKFQNARTLEAERARIHEERAAFVQKSQDQHHRPHLATPQPQETTETTAVPGAPPLGPEDDGPRHDEDSNDVVSQAAALETVEGDDNEEEPSTTNAGDTSTHSTRDAVESDAPEDGPTPTEMADEASGANPSPPEETTATATTGGTTSSATTAGATGEKDLDTKPTAPGPDLDALKRENEKALLAEQERARTEAEERIRLREEAREKERRAREEARERERAERKGMAQGDSESRANEEEQRALEQRRAEEAKREEAERRRLEEIKAEEQKKADEEKQKAQAALGDYYAKAAAKRQLEKERQAAEAQAQGQGQGGDLDASTGSEMRQESVTSDDAFSVEVDGGDDEGSDELDFLASPASASAHSHSASGFSF